MTRYVFLVRFNEEGRKQITYLPDLMRQVIPQAEQQGLKPLGWYLTLGPYDNVVMLEAPSDEALATIVLTEGMRGLGEFTAMRAFTIEEFERMAVQLPSPRELPSRRGCNGATAQTEGQGTRKPRYHMGRGMEWDSHGAQLRKGQIGRNR